MCGILGAVPPVEPFKFLHALDTIAHRGPDGYGTWTDGNTITLGHRRLAILDLSENGKQPMHYGRYVITFNGEIYNFLEIKKQLLSKGYQFTTDCDTEIIMAAYDAWGPKCVNEFNGMWAFAIWDTQKEILFLSRDRFGVKPMFYYKSKDCFIFASEMKALMPFLPEISVSYDFHEMKSDLFGYESTDKCLVKYLKRFPAGSNGLYDPHKNTLTISKFWDTKQHLIEVPKTYEEQVEHFRALFIDACKIRMRSDVPLGTALSGGLDSSSTICTMAHIGNTHPGERVSENWQNAFVAAFPGTFLDETFYAKKVTDFLNVKAEFITIDGEKSLDQLENYLYLFEELYCTSPVPMMETYKAMRENGVVVSLDGHGADELLSGYGEQMFEAFEDCKLDFKKVQNILNTYKDLHEKGNDQLVKEDIGFSTYLNFLTNRFKGNRGVALHFLKAFIGKQQEENASIGQYGKFNTLLYDVYHRTVLPTLLRNYDRYSMANGIEIRMPFMDYRLASFCFSLPWDSKLRGGYIKTILRDAMKDIVPDEVRLRKTKIGFNTPIVEWMKGPWKTYLLDTIHSEDFENTALLNSQVVKNQVLKVISQKTTYKEAEQVWANLTPYLWEKSFLKRGYRSQVNLTMYH
jgi:asparagine synthase (glutamine-hydrolysing)